MTSPGSRRRRCAGRRRRRGGAGPRAPGPRPPAGCRACRCSRRRRARVPSRRSISSTLAVTMMTGISLKRRSSRHTSSPSRPGSIRSSNTSGRRQGVHRRLHLQPVADDPRAEAGRMQVVGEQRRELRLVLDDEDISRCGSSAAPQQRQADPHGEAAEPRRLRADFAVVRLDDVAADRQAEPGAAAGAAARAFAAVKALEQAGQGSGGHAGRGVFDLQDACSPALRQRISMRPGAAV
jgi:hypothetical protein